MSLFKLVLKQCIDKGLVCGKRQALDSVYVKANASMSSMVEQEILEDASSYILIAKNWIPIMMKRSPQMGVVLEPIA